MSKADRETITYALSILRTAERAIDKTTVTWAEVATAIRYLGHIVDGRARDLGEAAEVEHQRYVESLNVRKAR